MSLNILIELIREMGFLNILGALFLLNTPAILFVTHIYVTGKTKLAELYIEKTTYNKDIKILYTKTLEPLHEDITKLRVSMEMLAKALDTQREMSARHDERLKIIHEQNKNTHPNG